MFMRGLVLTLALLGNIFDLGATIIDGTSSMKYFPQNYVFHDGDSAQGFVRFSNGVTILPGATANIDLWNSVAGGLDLRSSGVLSLQGDLRLDSNITLTQGGYLNSSGSQLVLGGDLTIAQNKTLHCGGQLVIDGNGHNLYLNPHAQIILDAGATVTFRNMTICTTRNSSSEPAIKLASSSTKLALDDVEFMLGNDFNFSQGQFYIHSDVAITGTSMFTYSSAAPSYIASLGCLYFDIDSVFLYAPASTSRDLLVMNDRTSALFLNGSTLATTSTGMRLTKGSIYFDNSVTMSSVGNLYTTYQYVTPIVSTNAYEPQVSCAWSPSGAYLASYSTSGRLNLYSVQSGVLTLINYLTDCDFSGELIWSADGTNIISSDSNDIAFVVNGRLASNSSMTQILGDGAISASGNYVARILYGAYLNISSLGNGSWTFKDSAVIATPNTYYSSIAFAPSLCAWSPNGQYVAAASPGVNGYINTYAINTSGIITNAAARDGYTRYAPYTSNVSTNSVTTFTPESIKWSPDGNYILCCGRTSDFHKVLSVCHVSSGGVLSSPQKITLDFATDGGANDPLSCSWSPDSTHIAVTSYGKNNIEIFTVTAGVPSLLTSYNTGAALAGFSWDSSGAYIATCIGDAIETYVISFQSHRIHASPTLSNCITFGNSTTGISADVVIYKLNNSTINVAGLAYHDAPMPTWRSLNDVSVDTVTYSLVTDLFLDADHKLIINENCEFDGAGSSIWFASNSSNVLQIAAGKSVTFTNITVENFDDAAISLGDATSSITFGDGAMLKLTGARQLTRDWHFMGGARVNGFGYPLNLSSCTIGSVGQGSVTLENIIFTGVKNKNIHCISDDSSITLRDCNLALADDFVFDSGAFNVENDVKVTGASGFCYQPSGLSTSTITANSMLYLDSGITFSYAPQTANKDLLAFTDKSSVLFLNGCTLKTSDTGMRLTKGSIYFDNTVTVSNVGPIVNYYDCLTLVDSNVIDYSSTYTYAKLSSFSPSGERLVVSTAAGLSLYSSDTSGFLHPTGVRAYAQSAFQVSSFSWAPNGTRIVVGSYADQAEDLMILSVSSGGVLGYPGQAINSRGKVYSIAWAPDGNNIFVVSPYLSISRTDGDRIWRTVWTDVHSPEGLCDFSPVNNYIAVTLNSAYGSRPANTLNIYKAFLTDHTALPVSTIAVGFSPTALACSPNGQYIACGGTNQLSIFRFVNEALELISSNVTSGSANCSWSPDGNYMVTTGGTKINVFAVNDGVPSLLSSLDIGTQAYGCSWSDNGSFIAVHAGNTIKSFRVNVQPVRSVQVSPTISNSITLGNSANGSSDDVNVQVRTGASVNVYGLINHDSASYQWQTRNQLGREVNATNYTQSDDLWLSKDQSLIVNESCVFNGDGHSIWFARSQLGLIQIAAGKSVIFTNVILKDFNDAAISLGQGSSVIFGDGVVIELSMPMNLTKDLRFSGDSTISGLGYDFDLSSYYLGILQPGVLTLQNIVLTGVKERNIRCIGDNASITLRDCGLVLESDFTFTTGRFSIEKDVVLTGTHTFSYEGSGNKVSTISANSTLFLDTGVTFSYAPRAANQDLLAFTDATSRLYLNGCTLKTTATGMRLTKGTMMVDNQNSVYNYSSSMSGAFTIGNGVVADDFIIQIMPNANIEIVEGSLVYNNQE